MDVKAKIRGAKTFVDDVFVEMRKATWPDRRELVDSTVVVIVSVCLLSVYVGVCDKVLMTLLRLLVPRG